MSFCSLINVVLKPYSCKYWLQIKSEFYFQENHAKQKTPFSKIPLFPLPLQIACSFCILYTFFFTRFKIPFPSNQHWPIRSGFPFRNYQSATAFVILNFSYHFGNYLWWRYNPILIMSPDLIESVRCN